MLPGLSPYLQGSQPVDFPATPEPFSPLPALTVPAGTSNPGCKQSKQANSPHSLSRLQLLAWKGKHWRCLAVLVKEKATEQELVVSFCSIWSPSSFTQLKPKSTRVSFPFLSQSCMCVCGRNIGTCLQTKPPALMPTEGSATENYFPKKAEISYCQFKGSRFQCSESHSHITCRTNLKIN